MHELLAPTAPLDETLYDDEFVGMTREMVTKQELAETRERLHADIRERMTGNTAEFLLSLHDAKPDFNLIGLPDFSSLPTVRWKLINLEKMKRDNPEKHAAQRNQLKHLFQ